MTIEAQLGSFAKHSCKLSPTTALYSAPQKRQGEVGVRDVPDQQIDGNTDSPHCAYTAGPSWPVGISRSEYVDLIFNFI